MPVPLVAVVTLQRSRSWMASDGSKNESRNAKARQPEKQGRSSQGSSSSHFPVGAFVTAAAAEANVLGSTGAVENVNVGRPLVGVALERLDVVVLGWQHAGELLILVEALSRYLTGIDRMSFATGYRGQAGTWVSGLTALGDKEVMT